MTAPHHSIVFLKFQHDLQLKPSPEFSTLLERVSQIKGWDYTCFGNALGQQEKTIVIIGWHDGTGSQTQTKGFWDVLETRLATEPTILNLSINIHWSTLLGPYLTEITFLRGSQELIRPERWLESVDLLCQRTVAIPDHEPPKDLVGCQGGVARSDDGEGGETVIVLLWRWTTPQACGAFKEPPSQYANLIGQPLKAATEAGARLETVYVDFERWRPKQHSQREQTRCLVQ
ncbi:hypothetical protein F4821DRAFT_147354 [Hypoxylon rubiginosum]|uniref:Uncharacterized protein n=1 Tax=Hypoxylon rubiginosum TaxID=110542 RepID=A0ACC0CZ51_9PEZI|nr:hypothetical protein F4821DRAFT_147354 [Hypoxylon rubiginosum]